MALSCADEDGSARLFRGAVSPSRFYQPSFRNPEHNLSVIVKSPEEYRALAKACLREAETVPESMRLSHIMIAQLWLELADKVTQVRLEIVANAASSCGSTLSK
jgi:hypothetical protein